MRFTVITLSLVVALAWSPGVAQVADRPARWEALNHYNAGQQLLRAEAWQAAEVEFRKAIELDPVLAHAHYGLGQTYMATKRYAAAVRAYLACRDAHQRARARQMSERATVMGQGQDELQQRQVVQGGRATLDALATRRLDGTLREVARAQEEDLAAFSEAPAGLALALGSAYFRSGSLADAEREYLAAVRANPALGEAHNNLAVVHLIRKRFDEAAREIELAEQAGYRVNPGLKKELRAAR